jgi:probable rRNA maturation factor
MSADRSLVDTGEITIAVAAGGWQEALPDLEPRIRRAVEAALAMACPDIGPAGVAVVLADDAAIRTLNRDWRGKNQPTNVLSFPGTETEPGETPSPPAPGMPLELGDVVLAWETCRREAEEAGKPLGHHVDHLVVHGVLHLLGHDHMEEDEAGRMERLEAAVLARLGVPDPYAA